MVDFSSDSLMTVDKKDINALIIIESQYYCIENIKLYEKQKFQNMTPVVEPSLKSSILHLYYLIREALDRLDPKLNKQIIPLIQTKKLVELLSAFELMQKFLWFVGITRFGVRRNIDTTNPANEDEEKGL